MGAATGLLVGSGQVPKLREALENHPRVSGVRSEALAALSFEDQGRLRTIEIGWRPEAIGGLIETMDNNPIVCADRVALPDAGCTLALIALAPLVRSGLIVEPPALTLTVDTENEELERFLANEGWSGGVTAVSQQVEMSGVAACVAMAEIGPVEDTRDLDALYAEAYERSLYVERVEQGDWDVSLVAGTPRAVFRLRLTPGEPHSLLTIQTMADLHGKCGAAQVVHAFNLMCGFEESLGIG